MPYIDPQRKLDLLAEDEPKTSGELNFMLTTTIINYLGSKDTVRYQDLNDVIGALEGCKLEFYRRVVTPYEEKKILSNGDVY